MPKPSWLPDTQFLQYSISSTSLQTWSFLLREFFLDRKTWRPTIRISYC
jgi:hypothetical protein